MTEHPFTQDIRAYQTFLVTDGILENNRVVDPGNPPDIPVKYAEWDDTISGVRMNCFRDLDNVYFYVPVGSHTTEQRLIDEDFILNWLNGKTVHIVNDYDLMTLNDSNHWVYQSNKSFERVIISSFNAKWRGYNMVSQWYWLSDEEMLDSPEYIECACWSIAKADI